MPSRRALDPAARYIADAWDDAHRDNPSLTMGEFARRTFPPLTEKRGAFGRGEMAAFEERAGGRLLGRILRGEADDTARQLLNLSYSTPIANIEFRNDKGYVSYSNWLMPAGFSSFDAFRLTNTEDARRAAHMIARGRVRDSAPFGGDRTGRGRIVAIRPIKVEQKRPYVGEFHAP